MTVCNSPFPQLASALEEGSRPPIRHVRHGAHHPALRLVFGLHLRHDIPSVPLPMHLQRMLDAPLQWS